MGETCTELFPGGNVCGRNRPCHVHEYPDQREDYLRRQLAAVTKRLETVRKQALDEAADVIQDELKRGGRVVDIDNSVNATAMIARIRALKLAAIRAPEEKK